MSFKALILEKDEVNGFSHSLKTLTKQQLLQQQGDTLIQIQYSSINYKDALALTNKSPVVRLWPMVPGIDGVGTVISCESGRYKPGDLVILNGWGCGESHWGCLSQYAYLKSEWLIPLPQDFTAQQAMAIGTAGYTAGLCVEKIIDHGVKPEQGNVLVTGASGGVGSFSIALLSKLGYRVTAMTSKVNEIQYLQELGAVEIIDSLAFKEAGKPLQKECWSAVVDVLGSNVLANACAQTQYGGIVSSCGLSLGLDFPSTVAPFILRGITLAGVDSVMTTYDKRISAWNMLAKCIDKELINHIFNMVPLSQCIEIANKMMLGQIKGRFVIDVNS